MLNQIRRAWQITILIPITIIVLVSCGINAGENLDQTTLDTYTATPIIEENTRTLTPAGSPTRDVDVTQSQPGTLPPISTVTRQPLVPSTTPTNTPYPTLIAKKESDLLSGLMSTNGGCELPCWWGIVPGQSTGQIARDAFAQLGLNRWADAFDGEYRQLTVGHRRNGESYFQSEVNVKMYEKDSSVRFLHVSGIQYTYTDPSYFLQDWKQYAVNEILENYGVPSSVQLHRSTPADPGPIGYDLVVAYDNIGFRIAYGAVAEKLSEIKDRVCFALEDATFIDLVLFGPHQYSTVDSPTTSAFDAYQPWEEVVGTGLNNFYQTFREDSSLCIEVDWSDHE